MQNPTATAIFHTARLLVRELAIADLDDLYAMCCDPEVMQYVGNLKPYSRERTRQEIEYALTSYREHGCGEWAFVEKSTGTLIGYGGILFPFHRQIPEISYLFRRDAWGKGKGYATEVARAIVEYAFYELGFEQVGASLDPANHISKRVLEKAGMSYVGEGVDEYELPILLYVIKRSE